MNADQAADSGRQVPLARLHRQSGAKMVQFAGWEMPLSYSGINPEHRAVRTGAGLFDVSHMGQIALGGAKVGSFLDHLLPRRVSALGVGRMAYAPMCAEDGGTIDDLLVYRVGEAEFMLVVNAAREDADWNWIRERANPYGVHCRLDSAEWAMLALQGPEADAALGKMGVPAPRLRYYQFRETAEGDCIGRSGYTGERGYEILCRPERAERWWAGLLGAGAEPCGLGARDTLRTEAGFCLYGHELDEKTSPLQAGLDWAVDLDGRDFIGSKALKEQSRDPGLEELVAIKMVDKGIPRPGYSLCDAGGGAIGRLSSGTYSPTLSVGIGLGMVRPNGGSVGTEIGVDMRGKIRRAQVVSLPFVPHNVRATPGKGK